MASRKPQQSVRRSHSWYHEESWLILVHLSYLLDIHLLVRVSIPVSLHCQMQQALLWANLTLVLQTFVASEPFCKKLHNRHHVKYLLSPAAHRF